MWDLGENPEPGGAGGSAGSRSQRLPGSQGAAPSPPRAALPGAASALRARSPPFLFRVCVGVRRAAGEARGARNGAGRAGLGARRGRGPGARPAPARSAERAAAARAPSERGTAGGRRYRRFSPARRHPVLSSEPPPRRGGAEARQRAGRKGGGGEREQLRRVGSGGAGRNFSLPPPRTVPWPRLPSRRLGTAPEAEGRGSGAGLQGVVGRLRGDVHWGSVCHRPPRSQWPGWGGAPAPRLPLDGWPDARLPAPSAGGCDPGRGPRHRGLPCVHPLHTHSHSRSGASCHRSPQAWGGGAEAAAGRPAGSSPSFPAPQAAAMATGRSAAPKGPPLKAAAAAA